MNRHFNIAIYLGMLTIACDQFSKWWLLHTLSPFQSLKIDEYFNVVHVQNSGMTFGILNHVDPKLTFYFLTGTAALILFFLGRWLWRTTSQAVAIALALVMGGAVGNVIDRVRFGVVIDFLDFHYKEHHWFAFNVADAAIVTGVAILLADSVIDHKR